MFGRSMKLVAAGILTVAAVTWAASPAFAQRGHGGGGFHGGGFHGSGFHGGYGGYHGGYHAGYYHGGYGRHYGYGGWGLGLGYYPYYGGYYSSYYPGYYGYSSYYYPDYSYYDVTPAYPSYSYSYPNYSYGTTAGYESSAPAADNEAHIHMTVPANAEVWFNDVKTKQTGTDRLFDTPELAPGKDYTYDVRVRYTDNNGQPKEEKRTITVHAGDHLNVNMMPST